TVPFALLRPLCPTLFPYTTLFRSGLLSAASGVGALGGALYLASRSSVIGLGRVIVVATLALGVALVGFSQSGALWASAGLLVLRSEEHTSELQSRGHLVCRLLLEK